MEAVTYFNFFVVGKLLENFLVRKLSSKTAKFGAESETHHFGEVQGENGNFKHP